RRTTVRETSAFALRRPTSPSNGSSRPSGSTRPGGRHRPGGGPGHPGAGAGAAPAARDDEPGPARPAAAGGRRGDRAGLGRAAGRGRGRVPGGADATMADRLVAILRRAVRAYQREPNFARLLILAATSDDPFASECYRELGESVYATLGTALDGLDPGERR